MFVFLELVFFSGVWVFSFGFGFGFLLTEEKKEKNPKTKKKKPVSAVCCWAVVSSLFDS